MVGVLTLREALMLYDLVPGNDGSITPRIRVVALVPMATPVTQWMARFHMKSY